VINILKPPLFYFFAAEALLMALSSSIVQGSLLPAVVSLRFLHPPEKQARPLQALQQCPNKHIFIAFYQRRT
jgi:hypothetical protein